MPNIGQVIREIREQQGLSQRYVADCCGISNHTVAIIERTGQGTLKNIEGILEALGYELEVVPINGRD